MIADYVTDLFNLDIYGLEIDRYGMWAIDWINNQQEKMLVRFEFLQNVFFVYNSFGDEALDYALRNAPASNCCIFEEFVSDNFRFDGKLGPANHMLIGPYGHWVTLSNFVNFDVISIVVNRCSLSVSDIYSFIRHWRAGGSPRMTFLRLELGTATNFENFEEEFEVVETDISGEYSLSDFTNDYSRKNKHFVNGYSIQRNDGVKAVIHYDDNCHFVMMVCPGENLHDRINYSKENFDQHFLLHQNV
ncbi:hypothetical protein B9Z55_026769 [Caenorhabditis nigoni]|nr:hypothetical protein B9Z55_026769 [Caenorhabditis nigoni]